MPVVINLTSAFHGGTSPGCGTGDHSSCGPDCGCGCPYTGMVERGRVEPVALIEQCYPNQWLALVIPPGEDEEHPEQAMLVAYSSDPDEVWDAVSRITFNQVVHVYFNGALEAFLEQFEDM
ncbi:hypothetical protein [Chloroflexus aggregans]|uniref:Uncharacterized protein n=1 Tax=Chloroflexus aggregans (strain MD-66 / DSM 9485) TaxID=326427 RepID=B8G8S0_CHLAD|nr:hypothetical protein [Chloroflexus aggregans]ACL24332.1 conserved hypothetical protein [Chloroflexus aggregans DSM 9485]